MSEPFYVDELIKDLSHPDWQRRYSAADRLKLSGDDRAVPALIGALRDENATVAFIAARTLGIMRSEVSVQAMVDTLCSSEDHDLQWAVAQALAEIGKPAVPALIGALDRDDPVARNVAADVLANIRDERAVNPLGDAFMVYGVADYEVTRRFGLATALEKFGEAAALPLLTALDHPEAVIRARSASALGTIRSEESVPGLADLLTDETPYDDKNRVCDIAAVALQKINTPEALEALASSST